MMLCETDGISVVFYLFIGSVSPEDLCRSQLVEITLCVMMTRVAFLNSWIVVFVLVSWKTCSFVWQEG